MNKPVILCIGERELSFNITVEAYYRCVNALQPDNKTGPMHNFLIHCASDEATRKSIKQFYEHGRVPDIFGVLVSEFKPDIEITVKK